MKEEKKYPLFQLRMREGATGPMTGSNSELLMDGKNLEFVTRVKIDIEAGGLARLTLETLGQFEVTGNLEPEVIVKKIYL